MDALMFLDILGLLVAAMFMLKMVFKSRRSAPFPPGPQRLPFNGNLLDMPSTQEWLTFADWGKKWGNIVSVSMLGQTIIIVNSTKVAIDMLEKQGAIYSERPRIEMGGELVGYKSILGLLPYGDRVRNYRKHFHQIIGSPALMSHYHPHEEQEARRFLKRVLDNPDNFSAHVAKGASALILRIAYGYEVKEKDDPFIMTVEKAAEQFALSTAPGGFLVNIIPALRYIPAWVPGAGFKTLASEWSKTTHQMVDGPYQFAKQQMASGVTETSLASRLLAEKFKGLTEENEFDIKWAAASMYLGAADTTVASIKSFFLAMVLFPEVLQKAQEEIDAVIGNDRLPCFADRPNLPYVNALVLEVYRWHSIGPTGVPHCVAEDNIYDGYFIPKGSLVIANIWNMAHNPNIYAEPFVFRPERFSGVNPEPDPKQTIFGFGRRICPGRVMADASVFIYIAMSLAVFKIAPYQKDGVSMKPTHEQMTGTLSHPKSFKCTISARTGKAVELILDSYEA